MVSAAFLFTVQVYTGKAPFQNASYACARGIKEIMERGHNSILGHFKPTAMPDVLWSTVKSCWSTVPAQRPTVDTVETHLEMMLQD